MHRGGNFQAATWSGPPPWTKPHANGKQNGYASGAIAKSPRNTCPCNTQGRRHTAASTGQDNWLLTKAPTNEVGCAVRATRHTFTAANLRCSKNKATEWINLVQQLREAPPVPWQQVHNTLTTLQHLNASGDRPIPPEEQAIAQRIATAGSQAPHGSHVHLGLAITQVISSSGYIPATAQETLLQTYLGPQFASQAATLAARWRQPHPPRPVPTPHAGPQHNTDGAPNPIGPPEEQRGQQTRQATDPSPSSSPSTDPSPSDSSSTESTSTSSDTGETHGVARARAPPPPRRAPPSTHTEEPTHHHRHQAAFHSLDQVDLQKTLEQKYCGFQSPPSFLKGRLRQALTFALEAIMQAHTHEQTVQAWKLWMLLPRMLLHRPPGTRTLSKADWRERIAKFQQDEWTLLLRQGGVHTDTDSALRPQDLKTPKSWEQKLRTNQHWNNGPGEPDN